MTTTCQICGRPIKARTGVIAHHGYQRPGNGWQTASCMGARHLPYEQSCDLIPSAIEGVKGYIRSSEARIAQLRQSPPAQLTYQKYAGGGRLSPVPVDRPDDFDPTNYYHSIPGTYENVYHRAIEDLNRGIRFAQLDLDFLTKRLADWKPPSAE